MRNFDYDKEKFYLMLEENGLKKFYDACEKLVDYWFCLGEADDTTQKMRDFVVDAGIYGNLENYVAIGKKKKGGKWKYVISRAFLPYNKLKEYYPKLEGRRWLTFYYEIVRWLSMIFRGGLRSKVSEAKMINEVDPAAVENITLLFSELGIM